ncbi:hypothetical protein [Frigoriflavimonas asaccharolytica]|uniref:NTF2-like N-terminal transpeptidase n=1 Tax=Frigoriflavimonas asaccharolytica TaxID=2735899 RepID=A0A8J8K3V0_9FLAO|nr:hypothetical protein [Frigoriflavimonas asaccharolytica]NRS91035.1 hypothetical protein [Frigoriflavimonas asaccharolytica]
MKKFLLLFIIFATCTISCKKDSVDPSSTQNFRASINDMTSSLNTLQQTKFNEALYILKTLGVQAEGEEAQMKSLRELLAGKKVPEIFALADQVALQNNFLWTSSGPPSLGVLNIFEDIKAIEKDPNEIIASALSVTTRPSAIDSILGPRVLQIIPRLVDNTGNPVDFKGAALETTMVVTSNGSQVLSSKNLMIDNNFQGFTIKFANLPADKIYDDRIDVTVTVKTAKKTYKMTKVGVAVNSRAMQRIQIIDEDPVEVTNPENPTSTTVENPIDNTTVPKDPAKPKTAGEPKTTVQNFLNNLSSQNLKNAYDTSANPSWGTFENFSNANSGFGNVKKLNVKNIKTNSTSANASSVNATYDVTDKNGKTTALQVTFGLKNVNGEWKISSYKIN